MSPKSVNQIDLTNKEQVKEAIRKRDDKIFKMAKQFYGDEDIVKTALLLNPLNFKWVDKTLKDKKDFVLRALLLNVANISYVPQYWLQDDSILQFVVNECSWNDQNKKSHFKTIFKNEELLFQLLIKTTDKKLKEKIFSLSPFKKIEEMDNFLTRNELLKNIGEVAPQKIFKI